jgi:selenocysteine lyase/cysteine desulfurase
VTLDHAHWNKPPHKEEAGSPNVVGAVALGDAVAILESVGMDAVAEHESALLQYAYRHLSRIPGVHLYGLPHPPTDKVGVITYNIRDMHHALVAAIMGIEGAIGIRNGCFCAHPYVKELLGLTAEDDAAHEAAVLGGDKTSMPGLIRASLGCYNSTDDIDALVEMTGRITRGEYQGVYVQERASGAYQAQGASMASGDAFPYLKDFFHHTKVSA